MSYSTKSDFLGRFTDSELIQLTSDTAATTGDAEVDTKFTAARDEADAEIDSYVGRRYVTPVSPAPARLKNLSIIITRKNLWSRRSRDLGAINETAREEYDDAISFLKDVAAGKAVLDGATTLTQNPQTSGGSVKAADRTFTPDSMSGL